jgi:uncharacterized Zn finger protein (UPF0148 family)
MDEKENIFIQTWKDAYFAYQKEQSDKESQDKGEEEEYMSEEDLLWEYQKEEDKRSESFDRIIDLSKRIDGIRDEHDCIEDLKEIENLAHSLIDHYNTQKMANQKYNS